MDTPRGPFVVADLDARGELHGQAEFAYADIERVPGAADLIGHFSGALWRSPEEFEERLPVEGTGLAVRWWAVAPTSGIATLRWQGEVVSVTLLATGISAAADELTFAAFQQRLLRELHDTGYEPAFALLELRRRPLAASFTFRSPDAPVDRAVAALADRCFAASYFRFKGLA